MENVKFNEKCSYEARLSARMWENGSGYSTSWDTVESWDIKSSPDLEWWVKAVSGENKSVFDYVTDNAEELSDGEESDNEWKMEIVQIDEDGEEKILAVSTIWESDLNDEQ